MDRPDHRAARRGAGRPRGAEAHDDVRLAARITANLGAFWHCEGHHGDGRRWTAHALAHAAALDAPRRPALPGRRLHRVVRSLPAAREHWDAAIVAFRALGDDRYLAYALGLVPGTYIGEPDRYDLAIGLCDEGIALARRAGDRPLIAQALNVKGELARVHGDDDLAREVYEEGKALAEAAGDAAHLILFLANLAHIADHRGDYEDARRLGCDALRLCWSLGRRMMAAWTIAQMAGHFELGLGGLNGVPCSWAPATRPCGCWARPCIPATCPSTTACSTACAPRWAPSG